MLYFHMKEGKEMTNLLNGIIIVGVIAIFYAFMVLLSIKKDRNHLKQERAFLARKGFSKKDYDVCEKFVTSVRGSVRGSNLFIFTEEQLEAKREYAKKLP